MQNFKKINLLPLIITMPAMIIGVLAMINSHVSPSIYGQNIFIAIIGGLISFLILFRDQKSTMKKTNIIVITCILILFLLTFLDKGLHGVHRWIAIGPLRFHIALVLVPLLIIELASFMKAKPFWVTFSFTLIFTVLLFFQPDASQLTAFTISFSFLLLNRSKNKSVQILLFIVFILLIILSWSHLDQLAPVSYVEDILSLIKEMGTGWLILAVISLLILLIPFFIFPPNSSKQLSFSLGIYFSISILSSFFGNFPLPIMGYGTSPFIGYLIAISWYVYNKK
ncbi:FtsW/RodA/SpoVE family cell cycle protein [Gottfriedia acidiceleris]|uniref:FtsW/RodA/SpoVE family cell cycle protein n=1 Tax=Gottfriedia acidiceleris TaxID=371036 RepID=UPI002F263419